MPLERQRTLMLPLPKSPVINIQFNDVRVSVPQPGFNKEKKMVLRGVSGTFKSGELSAIMGPSGAGKSTLLNILTGFHVQGMSGEVRMDGEVISPGKRGHRSMSCYIMQEDNLSPYFTVLEIMTIAANLKLGEALSPKAKRLVVEDLLDSLGMGSTLYTRCGRLSGGQKKRLCIALELIDNPPIMYLDEPTTGLDSSATTQLVRLLKSLAVGGRNIVCTIHQPSASIFEMFNHAYMISGGYCVYQGSAHNLVPFLQTIGLFCPQYHNPVDFMLDVMCGEFGEFNDQMVIAAKDPSWRSPPPPQDKVVEKAKEAQCDRACVLISCPSEWNKFCVLLKRNVVQLHRDWTLVYLRALLHLCVGVVMGLLFQDAGMDGDKAISNVSYFLCITVYAAFTSCMPAVLKFPVEIKTLKKEQFNNWYKLRTYYAAFLVTNIPIQMIFSLIFISISYYLSSQIMEVERFLKFVLIGMLTVFISEFMGLALGTATNPVNGIFWGSVILAVLILLAGFLAILTHMPVPLYYVSYLNFLRYALQSLVINMYGGDRANLHCPSDELYCHFKYPDKVLTEIAMTDVKYWRDVGALTCFCTAFLFIAYYFLHKKVKSR